jgi:hypothetical protein
VFTPSVSHQTGRLAPGGIRVIPPGDSRETPDPATLALYATLLAGNGTPARSWHGDAKITI